MITFIRYMSIATNLAFMVFLGFLIVDEKGTLGWMHGVNQLWFLFGAVAIIVLAALLAERAASRMPRTPKKVQPAKISSAAQPPGTSQKDTAAA